LVRVLERASGMLTAYALRAMNARRDALSWDPRDVAEDFLERHRRFAALR
jgi:glycine betaine/choline ABC-type transport system substrate-binding protein